MVIMATGPGTGSMSPVRIRFEKVLKTAMLPTALLVRKPENRRSSAPPTQGTLDLTAQSAGIINQEPAELTALVR